jgi:plastocyanin
MRHHALTVLGLVVVAGMLVAACGSGATPSSAPASGGDSVTIAGFAFDPSTITTKVGSTVSWSNTDAAPHTVAWDDGTEGSGTLAKGGTPYQRTFDAPGTFTYACGIHPAMKGTVVVEP